MRFTRFVQVVLISGICITARAQQPEAHDMDMMMPGHNHAKMHHDGMKTHQQLPITKPSEQQLNRIISPSQDTSLTINRDPHAYTDDSGFSHHSMTKMGDREYLAALIVDRLEGVNVRNDFSMTYDWQAWYGQDYNKILVRAEGEIDQGQFKNARNEALWSHALTAYWDTHLGVRYDSGLGADRVWGAFGVQGFAPYWIYVEATAYIGEQGRTAFRLETEYDILFTQKLILQPRIEVNFYSDSDSSRLISSGLSNIEAGLRLRYEFRREFAPYIGIEWANTLGSAADIIRAKGYKPEEARFVAGIHFWF